MSDAGSHEASQSGPQQTPSVPSPGSDESRSVPIPEKISGNVVISTNQGEDEIPKP